MSVCDRWASLPIPRKMRGSSNVRFLEHVNLNVPASERDRAQSFYLSGLGCASDTRAFMKGHRLLWANAGLQQFHLPLISGVAQVLRGIVEVCVATAADLSDMASRFERLAPSLSSPPSLFQWRFEEGGGRKGCGELLVTCPFGNKFRVTSVENSSAPAAGTTAAAALNFGGTPLSRGHHNDGSCSLLGIGQSSWMSLQGQCTLSLRFGARSWGQIFEYPMSLAATVALGIV